MTASFLDKSGLYIENLNSDEVQVLENNQPRDIELLARDELPTVYAMLFDTAMFPEGIDPMRRGPGSGPSGAAAAAEIAFALIDKYLARQPLMLASYERELHVVLDFTADAFAAKEVIRQIQGRKQQQQSFLYSALFAATRIMAERHERRRVIIVFLDTLDSGTSAKLKNLKTLMAASNAELFIVSVASRSSAGRLGLPPSLSQSALRELCGVTAGDALFTADYGEHLEDLESRLHNQIRTFYTLGFESNSTEDSPEKLVLRCLRAGSKAKSHPVVPVLR